MKRYWVSWYNCTDDWLSYSERCDGKCEPIESVLGYWLSGYFCFGDDAHLPTVVAVIDANSESDVMNVIRQEWPCNSHIVRFLELQQPNFVPNDRFPLLDWMIERFATPADQKA